MRSRVPVVLALAVGGWLLWTKVLFPGLSWDRVGPKASAGRQVVVLLHGFGASGDDLVGFARELSQTLPETSFMVPAGPFSAGLTGHSWIPEFSAPTRDEYIVRLRVEVAQVRAQLWKLIAKARSSGAACEDIYVGGFSQGGAMAAQAALLAPDDCHLGGLIVMSGGGLDLIELPTGGPPLRVLVTHGSSDSVVGVGAGRTLAHALAAEGHTVRWLQFTGQHQISPEVREAVAGFLHGDDVGVPAP